MKKATRKHIVDIVLTVLILAASFGISLLFQRFEVSEQITTLFAFSVLLISLITDGYLYGVISAIASVFIINYTFTYPYFNMDFSASSSIISAIIMLIIAVLTSAFTTRMKEWQRVKAESEKERMRANLLRAVSHDLRTPLTTIYGSGTTLLENADAMTDEQKVLFEKYTDCVREFQTITDCLIFQNSFKLGARVMLEVMEE